MTPSWLCLMNDWGAETPLWVDRGRVLLDLGGLGISASLQRALLAWQASFEREFDTGRGWSSEQAREQHADEAERLLRQLRAALPETEVTVDLWCVAGRSPAW